MLSAADHQAKYREIEDLQKRRAGRIAYLVDHFGWDDLAKRSGHSVAFLKSISGPNRTRRFPDSIARSLEDTLKLPSLWFDESP